MIKIDILQNCFLNEDGTFNKEEALKLSGKIAGICYAKGDFSQVINEPEEKTLARISRTINNGHHSVYDHISVTLYIQNIPKILAIILNNEHQYTTSERSLRYTPIVKNEDNTISSLEESLYTKWVEIFKLKIKENYGDIFNDFKIKTLAQENARYLVSVFTPTRMVYTTSLRQINYITSWMNRYIELADENDVFSKKIKSFMQEFINELKRLNILDDRLLKNEKNRELSLFANNLDKIPDYFSNIYSTTYKGSFVQLAQTHRHRTLDYKIEFLKEKEYYVPKFIEEDDNLVKEWLSDMNSVRELIPQGELVLINETGTYENFILKCKERLCGAVQYETRMQTRETLLNYMHALKESNSELAKDIEKYSHGARCTFPDYECSEKCYSTEGIKLTRKI